LKNESAQMCFSTDVAALSASEVEKASKNRQKSANLLFWRWKALKRFSPRVSHHSNFLCSKEIAFFAVFAKPKEIRVFPHSAVQNTAADLL